MNDPSSDELADIWSDDLLRRRPDADAIQEYLVGQSDALKTAGRPGAHTLAIDGTYGAGKSYLLRTLHKQVRLRHPAAFIDAWADDTIDAPWTALVVALEEALKPYQPLITQGTRTTLKSKGLDLVTALAKGAAKKGASYIIGEDGWDDAFDALFKKEAEAKIDAYRERKEAILGLRAALQRAIDEIGKHPDGPNPPVFIFVDELDRCKPTYAVRFLEEMKHLFDVHGVAFVLAVHAEQLQHAITGAYGGSFNSKDYIRRFIDRMYVLSEPSMDDLVSFHIRGTGLNTSRFGAPDENIQGFIAKSMVFWKGTYIYA